jgi:formate hydrogenlyase subunit 5
MSLKLELLRVFGDKTSVCSGLNNELYLSLNAEEIEATIARAAENNFELVCLFCAQNFSSEGFTLFYVLEKAGFKETAILQTNLKGKNASSVAKIYPSAWLYEREVTDGFGVQFDGAFDTRRLFLHDIYPLDFHPLLKSFKNQKIQPRNFTEQEAYPFREVTGEGVYQIPVGPVHAGIIEPGHFRFSVIGETIFNLEIRMFFKHRGLEKLSEGKTIGECVKIAESISGDETVANAVAFSLMVEKISQVDVPARAWQLRTILLEMERIYSLLGDLAGMILDVAYPVGASQFFIFREEFLRQNDALTGSRFMKGKIVPGGLCSDVPEDALANLSVYLKAFTAKFEGAKNINSTYFSIIDRFETTGKVKPEILLPLHITGPIARASGNPVDTRVDHPYGLYGNLKLKTRTMQQGDVLCRFNLKAEEILDAVKIIQAMLANLSKGQVKCGFEVKDGCASALVESARGQTFAWLNIKNGVVDRYKVRTASFCNWQAIEHAVMGNIVPDFPLINKSMNLSYAGTDL